MHIASIICVGLGAAVSLVAAAWLMFGFDKDDPRWRVVKGGGYTQSVPIGLYDLMIEQGKVTAVGMFGAALQLAGFVLGLRDALS